MKTKQLFTAIEDDSVSIVKDLITTTDLSVTNKNGQTPLELAAANSAFRDCVNREEHLESMLVLLENTYRISNIEFVIFGRPVDFISRLFAAVANNPHVKSLRLIDKGGMHVYSDELLALTVP